MTFGSLFTGIGGFDLGLERAGMEASWQVEIDPYCVRVLEKHWPEVPRYGDITTLDPGSLDPVDLICGGFPCQPVSVAGARKGQDDARWLWPEFARIIRALRPRVVLLENVPGLLTANGGRAFGEVLGDLAACGYDCEWDCIPASAVGAPHRRDRLWLVGHANVARADTLTGHRPPRQATCESSSGAAVAHADGAERRPSTKGRHESDGHDAGRQEAASGSPARRQDMAYANSGRREGQRVGGRVFNRQRASFWEDADRRNRAWWAVDPADPPDTDDAGLQAQRTAIESAGPLERREGGFKPRVGRVAHGIPRRVDRLRGLGNAVVPAVVEWIGRRIVEVHGCNS